MLITETLSLTSDLTFQPFPKIPRLNREIVITEKLDGTNAQILIDSGYNCSPPGNLDAARTAHDGYIILAGSRNRWLTVENDNYGFAKWVLAHRAELLQLGDGRHFGEWWGQGIQRGYGLKEKRFSLFNRERWCGLGPFLKDEGPQPCPACCSVVPSLYKGPFSEPNIGEALRLLRNNGSFAAPGFFNPEGIIVYHTAARHCFKVTLEGDEKPKGQGAE